MIVFPLQAAKETIMPNTTINSTQTHLSSLDNTWNKVIKDEKGVEPGHHHDPNIVRVNRDDY